ncbi:MAG TPA: hypothetical protein VIC26_14280 [Marinagarivorans sp.]
MALLDDEVTVLKELATLALDGSLSAALLLSIAPAELEVGTSFAPVQAANASTDDKQSGRQ